LNSCRNREGSCSSSPILERAKRTNTAVAAATSTTGTGTFFFEEEEASSQDRLLALANNVDSIT
jgi:hypothetical protein